MFHYVKQNWLLRRFLRLYFPPLSDCIKRLKPFQKSRPAGGAELASSHPICLCSVGYVTLGYGRRQNIWHDFFVLTRRFSLSYRGEIPRRLVLSAGAAAYPFVRRSPGKDQTAIYKSTLRWGVRAEARPEILASVSKSLAPLFDVPAPRLCGVCCPQLLFFLPFHAFIPCQSSWHQSRVCINECSPVGMKWFCHSRRTLSTPNTWLQNTGWVLMWVFFEMWRHIWWQEKSPGVVFAG